MKIKSKRNGKTVINVSIVMSILLVFVLSFVSVGYAIYGQRLNVRGTAIVKTQGKIAITNVELTSSKNVPDSVNPTHTDNSIDFDLTFEKDSLANEPDYQAIYSITITNNTFYDFNYNAINYSPTVYDSDGNEVDPSFLTVTVDGIEAGDKILAGEEVTFSVIFDFNPDTDGLYTTDGEGTINVEEQPHGNLLGSIPDNQTLNLKESLGNDIESMTVTVINTYESSRSFTINIGDTSHFRITDSSGNNLGSLNISGGTTQTYTFYIKRVNNAVYATDSYTTGIYLSYAQNSYVTCGNVTILVDEQQIVDTTPPIISNVSVSINNATSSDTTTNSVGSVTVTWDGNDAESGVKKYYIIATSNGVSNTYQTSDATRSMTITGLSDGTYVFKVYGENNHGYKASDNDINNATTSSGYCSSSTSANYDWHYTVRLTGQYMQALTSTAVNRGYDYSTTLRANANEGLYSYTLPNTISVTMNGNTISTGNTAEHYTYTNSSGAFTAYGATGDITITANATRSIGGCG